MLGRGHRWRHDFYSEGTHPEESTLNKNRQLLSVLPNNELECKFSQVEVPEGVSTNWSFETLVNMNRDLLVLFNKYVEQLKEFRVTVESRSEIKETLTKDNKQFTDASLLRDDKYLYALEELSKIQTFVPKLRQGIEGWQSKLSLINADIAGIEWLKLNRCIPNSNNKYSPKDSLNKQMMVAIENNDYVKVKNIYKELVSILPPQEENPEIEK